MKKTPALTKAERRQRRRPTMKVTWASVKQLARILASHRNHSRRGK
jgi:hypothetical protein